MLHRRSVIAAIALSAFAAVHLVTGLAAVTRATYATPLGVYQEFMGGAIRLLFPLIVGVIAGWTLSSELRDRYVVYVRTRRSFLAHLVRRTAVSVGLSSAYFFVLGFTTAIVAFGAVPLLHPGVVDPTAYGLTEDGASSQAWSQNPLGFALAGGPWAYGAAASAWIAVHAAIFAVATVAVVLWVQRPILALLTPFFLYLVESIATQVLVGPQYSFLISGPTPASLGRFTLEQGVLPAAALLLVSVTAIVAALAAARRSGAYS